MADSTNSPEPSTNAKKSKNLVAEAVERARNSAPTVTAATPTTHKNKLSMYYQNAHSIRNKVDEVRLATKSCPHNVVAFTETWLDDSISSSEHFHKRFHVYRCDRTSNTSDRNGGGGVLIAVDAHLNSERLILSDNKELEYVCVKINFDRINVFIFVVYIRSSTETEKFALFAEIVKLIPHGENDIVLVCGDFNQPGI